MDVAAHERGAVFACWYSSSCESLQMSSAACHRDPSSTAWDRREVYLLLKSGAQGRGSGMPEEWGCLRSRPQDGCSSSRHAALTSLRSEGGRRRNRATMGKGPGTGRYIVAADTALSLFASFCPHSFTWCLYLKEYCPSPHVKHCASEWKEALNRRTS